MASPGATAGLAMRGHDPDDEALEAWCERHRERLAKMATAELARIAPWLPIIGVPANDTPTLRDDQ